MSEIRILQASEFNKLANIEEGFIPNAEHSIAVVAENNGQIVGRMLLVEMVHIEGTWVHPDYRGGTVGVRLMKRTMEQAKSRGITHLLAYSMTMTDDYMARLGFKREPVTVWSKKL